MKRIACTHCQRPKKACICAYITPIENEIEVIILQHPDERNRAKNTITLLENSLNLSVTLVGELFNENTVIDEKLKTHHKQVALLYPSEKAVNIQCIEQTKQELNHDENYLDDIKEISCLIIIDATWKKSFKMFSLNTFLHDLPHVTLPDNIKSLYEIRKTNKSNALSSLEACCHALSIIEKDKPKYQALLNNFIKFNQFQLSFITN